MKMASVGSEGSQEPTSKRRRNTPQGTGGLGQTGLQGSNVGRDLTANVLIEIVVVFLGFLLQSFVSFECFAPILCFLQAHFQ